MLLQSSVKPVNASQRKKTKIFSVGGSCLLRSSRRRNGLCWEDELREKGKSVDGVLCDLSVGSKWSRYKGGEVSK